MRRLLIIGALVLLVALVGVRLAAPAYLTRHINQELDHVGKYQGHVDSVELHLWGGGFTLHGLRFVRSNGKIPLPLLTARRLRVATRWGDFLRGAATADVILDGASAHFVDGATEESSQTGRGIPWWQMLERLARAPVEKISVQDAAVAFHNFNSEPPIELQATALQILIHRPAHTSAEPQARSAEVKGAGKLYGALLRTNARFDPADPGGNFVMQLRTTAVDVTRLNDFTRADVGIRFESGTLDLQLDLDVRARRLRGSADAVLHDLKVAVTGEDAARKRRSVKQFLREAVAGLVVKAGKDKRSGDLVRRVQIDGDLGAAEPDTFASINAIVHKTLRKLITQSKQPEASRQRSGDAE